MRARRLPPRTFAQRPCARRQDIKKAVGLTAPWFDELLQRYTVGTVDEVHFESFVEFLETGRAPPASLSTECPRCADSESERARARARARDRATTSCDLARSQANSERPDVRGREFTIWRAERASTAAVRERDGRRRCVVPSSARAHFRRARSSRDGRVRSAGTVASSHDSIYPDVLPCMGFKPNDDQSIVLHKGTDIAPQNRCPLVARLARVSRCESLFSHTRPLQQLSAARSATTTLAKARDVPAGAHHPIHHGARATRGRRRCLFPLPDVGLSQVDMDGGVQELVETERSSTEVRVWDPCRPGDGRGNVRGLSLARAL